MIDTFSLMDYHNYIVLKRRGVLSKYLWSMKDFFQLYVNFEFFEKGIFDVRTHR